MAAAQQEASAAQRAVQQQADTLAQQLAEAEQAGQAIEAEAARLRARADADQHIMQLHAGEQKRACPRQPRSCCAHVLRVVARRPACLFQDRMRMPSAPHHGAVFQPSLGYGTCCS